MPEPAAPPRLRSPGAPLPLEPLSFRRPRPNGHKRPPSGQRFHLWVSGCQMNESDADYLSQGLTAAGFSAVADLDQADLAILVTCSVRQNAEQKAYGRFRELKAWKRARPGRAIAMTGCMANKEKDRLYERVPGIWRVRFLTSHPRHVHDDLLFAIRDLPRVCEHLHLPFQSGDDAILKQMRRRYTVDEYRAIIAHARNVIPDLSVSTDVIVGYPGETEEQFQRTLALLEEIKFDVVHIQGFSPRPRTTAARQADDVVPAEKKRRINVLLDAQRRIAEDANRRWLGRTVEVLVERAENGEATGRTRQNRVVIGAAPLGAQVGTVRRVSIEHATAWQLRGQVLN